ncbi:hypothetical protein L6452_18738 [Arctium lappa]|uniref:Uncharacterized protein n=1 Tax=Arctium lappa TaxID=4217 RepID=A0ACB9C7A8_ARCLA|nr:hypothetical protein L6452_18738 [Arctium lappa]
MGLRKRPEEAAAQRLKEEAADMYDTFDNEEAADMHIFVSPCIVSDLTDISTGSENSPDAEYHRNIGVNAKVDATEHDNNIKELFTES